MATVALKIAPFVVPTAVNIEMPHTGLRQDRIRPNVSLNISELEIETVEQLISDFAEGVMAQMNVDE